MNNFVFENCILFERGVTEDMVGVITNTVFCLPTSFKVLTREDVRAILCESL